MFENICLKKVPSKDLDIPKPLHGMTNSRHMHMFANYPTHPLLMLNLISKKKLVKS